ncbi:MAG: S8 family serine peptidase, partial [Gaiellaceae bacterium]
MRFRHSWRAARTLLAGVALAAALGTLAATAAFGVSGSTRATPQFTATDLSSAALETISVAKSDSGRLAQTDPSLLGRSDSTPINVMIKYDYDSTASYTGGVDGLAPTSPRVTHKKLRDNRAAVQAYEAHTSDVSRQISSDVRQAVPGVDVRRSYQTVYGGVEASVPANKVADLLKIDGVVAVQKDSLHQALDDNTGFIGATRVWPSLGGSRRAGSNVVVGMIDSGVWPEHPMLSPSGIPAPADGMRNCSDFATGGDVAHLGPPFSCNNKLIGAYAKTATYMAVLGSDGQEFCDNATGICSPRDSEGHGTHTTTTAAGDCVNSAKLYGVERGPVCGIAPGAHVIVYRVCLSQGCFSSDSVAAVQQAIVDGVDVINFSISGGAQPYTDPVELAFLDAVNAGISVNASAGNAGPGAGTSDHGGPWVTTVGASTGPRFFTTTLHLTADGGAKLDKTGVTVTNGISSPTPVVLAESIPGEDALCQTPLAAGAAAGKIVACQRGVNARVDKGFNVFSGGASGMILYNPVKQDVETDNHWLPAVHVDGPSTDLLDFINTHTNVKAAFAQGKATATQPDVMAAFSSRGPTGDWIKPDVTAPGIQVLAGMTPQPDETTPTNGPPGNLYQAIAGTSMSSPHATGVSALVKAAHPDWTPEEIKSALMTSSVQKVVKEDGTTPADPFDMGAGSIRADRAVNPTLVFNVTFADFVAAGSDPLHRIDLNIPSVDATTMTGKIVTHRTAI